jgi:hypothetical protein
MKATGFSFPCPILASNNEDEAFKRFYETAKPDPTKIHNPWPLLAGLKTYYQARTQPLVRTSYLPTTDPGRYGLGSFNFKDSITSAHEIYHVSSDNTPAKVFARFILSRAFDNVSALLRGRTWNSEMEKSWNELGNYNNSLTRVCRAITLSEELLATAMSIEVGGVPEELELHEIEEEIFTNYQEVSLYLQPFRKMIQWNIEYPGVRTYLEMFLQGIKISRSPRAFRVEDSAEKGLLVVNSAKRCRILAERVRDMNNGKECYDWLCRTLSKGNEIRSYFAARQLFAELRDTSEERYYLWILMQGREVLEVVDDSEETRKRNATYRVEAILYPQEFEKGWYIRPKIVYHNRKDYEVEKEILVRILAIESLLEQLIEGIGICCPHYNPLEGCHCDPDWKESLNCIARWGMQGKFRTKSWQDLPQECRNKPKRTKILGNHRDLFSRPRPEATRDIDITPSILLQ